MKLKTRRKTGGSDAQGFEGQDIDVPDASELLAQLAAAQHQAAETAEADSDLDREWSKRKKKKQKDDFSSFLDSCGCL